MAEKKGSKKTDDGEADAAMICKKCGSKRQPYRLIALSKARMVYECKCGILDRGGSKA